MFAVEFATYPKVKLCIPCAGVCTIAGSGFGGLYIGAATGGAPFFQLKILEGVDGGETTGAGTCVGSI